jgi:hypothetical protein
MARLTAKISTMLRAEPNPQARVMAKELVINQAGNVHGRGPPQQRRHHKISQGGDKYQKQPAAIPGNVWGTVIFQKVAGGSGPQVGCGF